MIFKFDIQKIDSVLIEHGETRASIVNALNKPYSTIKLALDTGRLRTDFLSDIVDHLGLEISDFLINDEGTYLSELYNIAIDESIQNTNLLISSDNKLYLARKTIADKEEIIKLLKEKIKAE